MQNQNIDKGNHKYVSVGIIEVDGSLVIYLKESRSNGKIGIDIDNSSFEIIKDSSSPSVKELLLVGTDYISYFDNEESKIIPIDNNNYDSLDDVYTLLIEGKIHLMSQGRVILMKKDSYV